MNKDALTKVLIFVVGAGIGSAATWYIAKTKYEQIANEEIESVKQHYKMKAAGEALVKGFENGCKNIDEPLKERADEIIETVKEYRDLASKYLSKEGKEEEEDVEKPYVISPDEFGEMDDYETESLTLYSDGVLADDTGNIIDDVEGIVGKESLTKFGEYEDDSVFVRNDARKCDYEILADDMTYDEAYGE